MFERVKLFFLESKQEFKHVNWPNFAETRRLTAIVIGMSLGVAVFLGLLDALFTYLLERFFLV
jgi:preprotein translocase subunit SecE